MILFDGCSFTYGDELENPEKDAYPHLVARMGLRDGAKPRIYRNIGECGKSNDGILRTTLEFCENNPVSSAIIQFTKFSRREIKKSHKKTYFHVTAENRDEGSLEYYKNLQNDDDDVANFYKNKFLLENYFKKRNIRHFFFCIENLEKLGSYGHSSWYELSDKKPIMNTRKLLGRKRNNPLRYSGGHPSILGHQIIAKEIYENFF
mgnify:CR=1 FL=1